jgi:uncharacterized protein YdeI (YjbR/CyaY-like superfamily)
MASVASPDFRHDIPPDLKAVLTANASLKERWGGLTDLGRNEWICWMTSPKTEATRAKRLERLQEEVAAGKRRPCCWPGCPHRPAGPRGSWTG